MTERRRVARIAPVRQVRLVCVAAFAVLQVLVVARAQTPTLQVRARQILTELVGINTTHDHGTAAAVEYLAGVFLSSGFPPADVAVVAPQEHPAKANLVVRLRGRGRDKPILYLCHLDVVEAAREDWTFPPFELTEEGEWLYGRGTIDMKGQGAAVAATLITLKAERFVPARDIVVAFTADEEAGGDSNGVAWLFENHPALVDASLVINPDGGEAASRGGKRLYLAIQTSEKIYLTLKVEATDKGGHSSQPTNENAIYRLAAALSRLSQYRFPVHLTKTATLYFARRAELEQGVLQADMRAVAGGSASQETLDRLSLDSESNVMLRTTCTATMIEGGHAENALPQRVAATIQCRIVPGESIEAVEEKVRTALADPRLAVSIVRTFPPAPETEVSGAMLRSVERVTRAMWPEVIVLPKMSGGGTDSSYTRRMGLASYGIDGTFIELDDQRAHGRDERIGVQAFRDETDFTYRLMKELSATR